MSKTTPIAISYAGTFERSMDAKNRVTIPAAWLSGGPDEFHAIPGPSGDCLIVMPPAEFDSIESRIEQSGAAAPERRKAIRQFYGQARSVSADSNVKTTVALFMKFGQLAIRDVKIHYAILFT